MKILVGLSGGVDSAVAAKLLLEQGHEVSGVTMQMISPVGEIIKSQEQDIADARAIANTLGIDFFTLDLRSAFREEIMNYFAETYKQGLTPNPCFICNKKMKFGRLLDAALERGFDAIATGHYAQIMRDLKTGRYLLLQGSDSKKDQSYFLALLNQFQLAHIMFPLGNYTKPEVRKIAEKAGLISAHRPDSQDICFVPNGDYAKIVEALLPETFTEGNFLDTKGKIIGKHRGLHHYTIGQRRGLALAFGEPVYVVSKDAKTNTVCVGSSENLFASALVAENVNFIAVEKLTEPIVCTVKTRYRQNEIPARLIPITEDSLRVEFLQPERAVAAGQALVCYKDGAVFAGGIITAVEPWAKPQ
ncbi:tRNA 2-thiouridine(34) synthase MnmA [Treponema phagedenis]|uniref:tRNA 2-thiouridine(34) synthase MnmA n=1 Tax=Treponema phagedenis TaxID=162 RepID=UPI0011E63DD3|nr:tRNA 2-thiouridine(34) synthase MnmA [Treponema phagedenis]QEK07640.1 tRNA 2-thiouridine(34) synthase MnmA [Treponema phagedenis]